MMKRAKYEYKNRSSKIDCDLLLIVTHILSPYSTQKRVIFINWTIGDFGD